jgi:hypothetical protein
MKRFRDPHSRRHVWVIEATTVSDWPATAPWSCPGFGLLLAAEHAEDAGQLASTAVTQGLAFACAWGPGCSIIEEAFDEAIVGDGSRVETHDDVILTTSHADESLEEAIEFFLDAATPSKTRAPGCDAWVVFALGPALARRVENALMKRGATPES